MPPTHETTHRIDADREMLEFFQAEEFMGFFDFSLPTGAETSISGLAKIARPKAGRGHYVSLVLILDTTDSMSRTMADQLMNRLDHTSLAIFIPEMATAVSMPQKTLRSGVYLKHIDILLKKGTSVNRLFVESRLIPALKSIVSMKPSPITWHDSEDQVTPNEPSGLLLRMIRRFIGNLEDR